MLVPIQLFVSATGPRQEARREALTRILAVNFQVMRRPAIIQDETIDAAVSRERDVSEGRLSLLARGTSR